MYYSIIIPVYNEEYFIPELLSELETYSLEGHEIIIVNDGSTDKTFKLLSKCKFIKLLDLKSNQGKGIALRLGLNSAKNENIIIFDGDIELHPNQIKRLMYLNKDKNINCIFASRYSNIYDIKSFWDFGNIILTILFNLRHNSNINDALCCAKAFFKSNIELKNLKAKKFDIDVEIGAHLVNLYDKIDIVHIDYKRRYKKDGKKLSLKDSFIIIKKLLMKI